MTTSGRYHSKLFSFFARQSLRLRDRSSQTWRQVKLAAIWGAQIVLYPIYVGLQATRLASKQLRHTAQQVLPRLQAATQSIQAVVQPSEPPFADRPIQKTLQAVQDLNLRLPASRLALELDPRDPTAPGVMVVVGNSALSAPADDPVELAVVGGLVPANPAALKIQAVASWVATRSLVLVTTDNQVLDVLTLDQQRILQQRIVWELASYCRQRRLLTPVTHPWVDRSLPLPLPLPHALPPVNAVRHLLAWMQTSPVAVAVNLFHEAELALTLPAVTPPLALPSLDVPLRSAQTSWKTLGQLADRSSQLLSQTAWGDRVLTWLKQGTTALVKLPSRFDAAVYPAEPTAELTLEELFPPADSQPSGFSGWRGWWTGAAGSRATDQATPEAIVHQSRGAAQATRTPVANSVGASSAAVVTTSDRSMVSPSAEETDLVAPSWIEAEAHLVRYEKHPLEQLLEWLDRGLSWVEDRVAVVWQWLHKRWRR